MCGNKFLYVSLMVVLALFLGCSKSKNSAAKRTEVSKTLPSTADTADIFKEFYSDDTAKKSASKKTFGKSAKTTFSPASAAAAAPSSAEFLENGRYVVQVSCVKSQTFAEKMAGGLKDKGYPAYVAEVQNPTPNLSGTFYRIRIGGFNAFSAAKGFGENTLSPNGYQYWVDKKSNDKVGMEGYGLGSGAATGNVTSSYENAPLEPASAPAPASSWSGTSTSSPGQSSTPSSVPSASPASSSSSAASPAVSPAPEPAPAPAPAKAPSSPPPASSSAASGPSPATKPASAPSAATQPSNTPAPSTTAGGSKSSGGSSDWGADSSASGSGW
ncbi:MAG: SPOR domain-containing protein [Chitinivibrionales bacterium]